MASLLALLAVVREIIKRMMRHFAVVIVSVAACLLLVVLYANLAGERFTTTMIVAPVSVEEPSSNNNSALGQSAIARLGFGGLGGSDPTLLASYVHLIQSQTVAQAIMQKPGGMQILFGPDQIDPASGLWRMTQRRALKRALMSLFGVEPPQKPTVDDGWTTLQSSIVVDQDSVTNLLTLTCISSIPARCATLLLAAHQEAEKRLNNLRLNRQLAQRNYIEKELPNVPELEVRQALISSLATAEQNIVSSQLGQTVAASVIEPPILSQVPTFPKPLALSAFAVAFGLLLGGAFSWYLADRRFFQVFPQLQFHKLNA